MKAEDELPEALTALSRQEKIDLIKKASTYRSGADSINTVYMGSMAMSSLKRSLGGFHDDSLDLLLINATEGQLRAALRECQPYIKTMIKKPTAPCPCCGQITDKRVVDAFKRKTRSSH